MVPSLTGGRVNLVVQQVIPSRPAFQGGTGMGIGLKLCRSIVESHQGRLEAENLYNGNEVLGCRFTFWLPAVSEAPASSAPPQHPDNAERESPPISS